VWQGVVWCRTTGGGHIQARSKEHCADRR
jgi:hypothetical protein